MRVMTLSPAPLNIYLSWGILLHYCISECNRCKVKYDALGSVYPFYLEVLGCRPLSPTYYSRPIRFPKLSVIHKFSGYGCR